MHTTAQYEKKEHAIVGIWHNQHGTEIEFTVMESGRITGSLTLREPDGTRSQRYPITGFANCDILTFCADFGKHDSMTAWVGQFTDSKDTVEALWNMVLDAHGQSDRAWKAIVTGSDVLVRGACPDKFSASSKPASHPLWCGLAGS